jgi:hypothetical protein
VAKSRLVAGFSASGEYERDRIDPLAQPPMLSGVSQIFFTLDLRELPDHNRRVLAVLAFLRGR